MQQVPLIQMVPKTVKVPSPYETIKLFPVERIPERDGDHIVDVPVPQTSEEVAEVVKANEEMIDAASHSFAMKLASLIQSRSAMNSSSRPIFQ